MYIYIYIFCFFSLVFIVFSIFALFLHWFFVVFVVFVVISGRVSSASPASPASPASQPKQPSEAKPIEIIARHRFKPLPLGRAGDSFPSAFFNCFGFVGILFGVDGPWEVSHFFSCEISCRMSSESCLGSLFCPEL